MKVVKSSQSIISLDELQERLRENDGILLWIRGSFWKILKAPHKSSDGNKYSYGWASLYFDRSNDCANIYSVSSTEDLIKFISEEIQDKENQFYWFPSGHDFVKWIRETDYDPRD